MGSSGPRDSIYAPFVRLRFKRLFDGRLPFCTLSFGSVLNFWQHRNLRMQPFDQANCVSTRTLDGLAIFRR